MWGVPVYGGVRSIGGPGFWEEGRVPVSGGVPAHRVSRFLGGSRFWGDSQRPQFDPDLLAGGRFDLQGGRASSGRVRRVAVGLQPREAPRCLHGPAAPAQRSAPALPAPGPARRAGRERATPVPPRSRLPPPGTRRLRKKSNTGPGGGAKMAPGTGGGRTGRGCSGDGGHRGWGEQAVGRTGGGEDGGWEDRRWGAPGMRRGWGEPGREWGGKGMGSTGDRGWGARGMGGSGDREERGWGGRGSHRGWGAPGMGRRGGTARSYRGCSAAKLRCCRAPLPRRRLRLSAALGAVGVRRNFPGADTGGRAGRGGGSRGRGHRDAPSAGHGPTLGMGYPEEPRGVMGESLWNPMGVMGKYSRTPVEFFGLSVPLRGCYGRGTPGPLWGCRGGYICSRVGL